MEETTTGFVSSGGTSSEESRTERMVSEGKEKAAELGGKARERVLRRADDQKDLITRGLDQLADGLERTEEGPQAELMHTAARYVRRASSTLRDHSSEDLVSIARDQLREHPAAMAAGFFAAGLIGARLLRS